MELICHADFKGFKFKWHKKLYELFIYMAVYIIEKNSLVEELTSAKWVKRY